MAERKYRVQIDTWVKNCLMKNGATTEDDYEWIDEDVYIIHVDKEVHDLVESKRAIGETWGQSFKSLLMLELIMGAGIVGVGRPQ